MSFDQYMSRYEEFFTFAVERHLIYMRKKLGKPAPWTDDPILQKHYFTNVYREYDKTTAWFRKNIRNRMRNDSQVLLATVVFRWFNRIDVGEIIFLQPSFLHDSHTPFEMLLDHGEARYIEEAIRSVKPTGQWVNGAYIIKGTEGMDKLAGICDCIQEFHNESGWRDVASDLIQFGKDTFVTLDGQDTSTCVGTMEGFTRWLAQTRQIGMFMAYEIACDLRYTNLLYHAPDVKTWANPGPGALRGLSRIVSDHPDGGHHIPDPQSCMIWLMEQSDQMFRRRVLQAIPHEALVPPWEMREVEHTLCEFDKYERVRQGGTSKRRYRHG